LTFGTLKIAESNLDYMINWLYWVKPRNPSHDLIQDTILMEITDYITGPNDLLREQVKIINYAISFTFSFLLFIKYYKLSCVKLILLY